MNASDEPERISVMQWEKTVKPISMWLRRLFGRVLLAVTVAVPISIGASAQQLLPQEIHLICGFPAGSGADAITRFYGNKLRVLSGRTVLVENRLGAGGNIAIEYAARSKPDGSTILVNGGPGLAANMYMYKKPPIESVNAFRIVATLNRMAFMLVVEANKPWKTVADLTAAMKAKGEKATYATSTPTSIVMGALYKEAAGLQAVDVNYRTSTDAYNDMLSGSVDYGILEPVSTVAAQRQGKLRILGVSGDLRLEAAPNLPTMIEGGVPGVSMNIWLAAMVPAKTPKGVTEQLNRWFDQITASDDARRFLNTFASDPFILSPDDAQALINKEVQDWARYLRIAKIEPQG